MTVVRPYIVLCGFGLALAAFWFSPEWLGLDDMGLLVRGAVAQVGGPLVAAICCGLAARRSTGGDRSAWINFGIGSTLYLAGNLFYLGLVLAGIEPVFPTIPEAAYFLMAGFFVVGIFQYGKVRARVSGVQIYNFLMIYCAIALASLFALHSNIAASTMPPFATILAFLYPVLWWSVAASGLLSLLLYRQGTKAMPFAILLLAIVAEAAADSIYVLDLMEGSYREGGLTALLWVAFTGLIIWAAVAQMANARQVPAEASRPLPRRRKLAIAQAAVPASAAAIILLAGSFSGSLGNSAHVWLAAVLSAAFAIVVGLREHWIIHVQRTLRGAIEDSRAEHAKTQQRLTAVLESTTDSVVVLDRDWRIEFFNERAAAMTRERGALRIGEDFWATFPTIGASRSGERYREAAASQQAVAFEQAAVHNRPRLDIHAYPTPDGLSIFFRDISDEHAAREALHHMAHYDALTGLPNRAQFQARLSEAIASGPRVAALLLDLDHFKEVNDSLGHPIGDELLAATAGRLRACLEPGEMIARLGGDEFAVILTNYADLSEVTGLARRLLSAASATHLVDTIPVRVSATVGVALATHARKDPDQMFKNADMALYAAKGDARGTFRIFEPKMEIGRLERQALRADLSLASENREFELAYQPIVDLHTDRVCGFEALVRWRHPTRGLISPVEFIPLAEESGQIVVIGDWVLRTACAEAATWPDDVSVAVNLSPRQFSHGDLVDSVKATLAETGLPSHRLEIEITESVLLADSRANLLTLRRLRDEGVRIALDDFGTGYSSLGYLQRFPFSKIKIDRSFVSGLPASEESQAIVRSVIGLGQSLGMRVTAEGVETAAQYAWVGVGCDEAQGYFISKPVPACEVLGILSGFAPRRPERRRRSTG